MIEVETRTEPVEAPAPPNRKRVRHVVELDESGQPMDECLCGYLWDVYPIPFDPEAGVCSECMQELQRRYREEHP